MNRFINKSTRNDYKEGLTKTDVSSAEDYDIKHKRKCKKKTSITMESLLYPSYSGTTYLNSKYILIYKLNNR